MTNNTSTISKKWIGFTHWWRGTHWCRGKATISYRLFHCTFLTVSNSLRTLYVYLFDIIKQLLLVLS